MRGLKKYLISTLLVIGRFFPSALKDRWFGGAAAGIGVTGLGAAQLLSLLGFTAVSHSSGAMILTGAGGYIAGTYGIALLVGFLTAPLTLALLLVCTVVGLLGLVRRKLRVGK